MKNSKIISIALVCCLIVVYVLTHTIFKKDTSSVEVPLRSDAAKATYTIVAFGDSLTAGYGLPLAESYPAQLEEKLKQQGFSVKVINAGVSGETSKGNTERASFIKSQNPDMVILGIGGNDALRGLPVSEMKRNMENTIQLLQRGEKKPKILLLQMQAPLNLGFQYKQEFDAVYTTLASVYGLPLVPFLVSDVFLDTERMLPDQIHPNKEGYKALIDTYLFATVVKEIEK